MSEERLPSDMKEALNKFFKGAVKVYEAGAEENNPEYIQERPLFSVLPKGNTTYLQLADNKSPKDGYVVTQNKPADKDIVETESHKFFKEMEERFRNVQPNMTLFVIDPDVIRARYAMDESPDRNLGKTMFMYLQEKLDEVSPQEKHYVNAGEEGIFVDSSMPQNRPFSMTLPKDVTEDNIKGNGTVSIVIGDNPDHLKDPMFPHVIGMEERLEKEEITREDVNRIILLHEFGHAMDIDAAGKGRVEHLTGSGADKFLTRHRTECVADAHAVLQMARHSGNTKLGKIMGDTRAIFSNNAIKAMQAQKREISKIEKQLNKILAKKSNNSFGTSIEEQEAKKLEVMGQLSAKAEKLGMSMSYNTTPVVEAALKFAEEGLKDGSLMKMTDKEIIDKASVFSKEHGFSKAEMSSIRIAAAQGKTNDLIKEIEDRAEIAKYNVPLSKEDVDKRYAAEKAKNEKMHEELIKKILGIAPKQNNPAPAEMQKMVIEQVAIGIVMAEWVDGIVDSISEKGCDGKALLKAVGQEKDAIRKNGTKDFLGDMKLKTLNEAFLMEPTRMVQAAKARKSVNEAIGNIQTNIPQISPEKALAAFIGSEVHVAKMVQANLDMAEKRTPDMAVHDQMASMTKEQETYMQILTSERGSQVLAKIICEDKALWSKLSKEALPLADMIEKKANLKHNDFVDSQHMLFSNNDQKMVKALKMAVGQKLQMMVAVVKTQPMLQAAIQKNKPAVATQIANIAKDIKQPDNDTQELMQYYTGLNQKETKASKNQIQQGILKNKRLGR